MNGYYVICIDCLLASRIAWRISLWVTGKCMSSSILTCRNMKWNAVCQLNHACVAAKACASTHTKRLPENTQACAQGHNHTTLAQLKCWHTRTWCRCFITITIRTDNCTKEQHMQAWCRYYRCKHIHTQQYVHKSLHNSNKRTHAPGAGATGGGGGGGGAALAAPAFAPALAGGLLAAEEAVGRSNKDTCERTEAPYCMIPRLPLSLVQTRWPRRGVWAKTTRCERFLLQYHTNYATSFLNVSYCSIVLIAPPPFSSTFCSITRRLRPSPSDLPFANAWASAEEKILIKGNHIIQPPFSSTPLKIPPKSFREQWAVTGQDRKHVLQKGRSPCHLRVWSVHELDSIGHEFAGFPYIHPSWSVHELDSLGHELAGFPHVHSFVPEAWSVAQFLPGRALVQDMAIFCSVATRKSTSLGRQYITHISISVQTPFTKPRYCRYFWLTNSAELLQQVFLLMTVVPISDYFLFTWGSTCRAYWGSRGRGECGRRLSS